MLTTHISINDYPNFREYCIVLHWYIFDIICSTWTNIYWSRSCSDTIDTISVDLREYTHLPFGFTLRPTPRLNFIHCTCTLLTPTFPNRFRTAHNGRISRRFPHHRTGHKYWKTPRVTINVWGFRTYIAVARSWALTNEFPSKKNSANVIKMTTPVSVIMNSAYGFIFWPQRTYSQMFEPTPFQHPITG